jgi:hypothetical protein
MAKFIISGLGDEVSKQMSEQMGHFGSWESHISKPG